MTIGIVAVTRFAAKAATPVAVTRTSTLATTSFGRELLKVVIALLGAAALDDDVAPLDVAD